MYICARGSSFADAGASRSRIPMLLAMGSGSGAEAPAGEASAVLTPTATKTIVINRAAKRNDDAARCWVRDVVVKVYATEWVIVAVYVPAAMPPGMRTEIVGDHVAELSPVMALAVTAGETPVRSGGSFAVYTAVPTLVMVPAV